MNFFTSIREKLQESRAFVAKNQRFIPVIAFFAGFTWDNITITRIDTITDNLIIGLYLAILGFLIILLQKKEYNRLRSPLLLKYSSWFPSAIQFFLGGLFSVYVVFYFKSASFSKSAIFLIILIIVFVANEFLAKRLTNSYLLFCLYFLAAFSYFIFFIPVATGIMNVWTFLLGSFCGLMLPIAILYLLKKQAMFSPVHVFRNHAILVGSLFLLLNLFYWLNLIPPVPLAMKFTGIYHHAAKKGVENSYVLRHEKPAWFQLFKQSDSKFHYSDDDTVFCFASIFAPTKLTKQIAHRWQYFELAQDNWITTDRIVYRLTGGRDGGYRGYTFKTNIRNGFWRVDIVTEEDLILGRIKFQIVSFSGINLEFEEIIK